MSVTSSDFKLTKLQFVFFTPNFYVSEKSKLMANLVEKFSGGEEIILPLPAGAPADIPSIILSKKDKFEIRIARNRIDYTDFDVKNKSTNYIIRDFVTQVKNLFDILNHADIEFIISDIGFVIQSIDSQADDENFAKTNELIKPLFNQSTYESFFDFGASGEISLRGLSNQTIELAEKKVSINKIFRFNTAPREERKRKNALFLEFDRNTFPENKKDFGWAEIDSFIRDQKNAYLEFLKQLENLSEIDSDDE